MTRGIYPLLLLYVVIDGYTCHSSNKIKDELEYFCMDTWLLSQQNIFKDDKELFLRKE